eukprot:4172349-Alexandrium_andersonii.AAC.1
MRDHAVVRHVYATLGARVALLGASSRRLEAPTSAYKRLQAPTSAYVDLSVHKMPLASVTQF